MRILVITLLILLTVTVSAQSAFKREIIKFEDYEKLIDQQDNILYVINFWATWCPPCVKELPDFMAVNEKMKDHKDFKMILVSVDNKDEWESGVIPFAADNKLNVDVYLLDELRRMNYWMPRVDKNWMGSIPATLFYKNGKKLKFVEKPLHKEELETIINQLNKL